MPDLRTLRRALFTTALLASPGLLTLPGLQVLATRFITPVPTLTVVEHELQAWQEGERRRPSVGRVRLDGAEQVARAVVSSEDGRFFLHGGFDLDGICAAWRANQEGGRLRGGSTITQQVARNAFLFQQRSWTRKALETHYAILLELLLPKTRILELYLSIAETGDGVYGFEAAAEHHYGKTLADLGPDQAARLAYLLPSPRTRSPRSTHAGQKARWIRRNLAPFPGDPGFDEVERRWAERPWWPPCSD